jgi:ditrans,polycis-polyprenyl diphosphate synthase
MDMAKVKLKQLVQHGDILDRYGARIQILGQRELIKPDVLEAVDRAVASTAHNTKCVLNVCFPYTSREEITHAVRETVKEYCNPIPSTSPDRGRRSPFKEERIANTIRSQHLSDHHAKYDHQHLHPPTSSNLSPSSSTASLLSSSTSLSTAGTEQQQDNDNDQTVSTPTTAYSPPSQPQAKHPQLLDQPVYPSPELITPTTITSHTYTSPSPPVDLLVRTSGVSRLSDFLLWQVHEDTEIVFLDVLWPEFDLWSFLPVLWGWQWRVRKEEHTKREGEEEEMKLKGLRVGVLGESLRAS